MFQQRIDERFATDDPKPNCERRSPCWRRRSVTTATERDQGVLGALHGISPLERASRMRPDHRAHRLAELGIRVSVNPRR
jgi:hypothetical protein